jgi:hypothetical protein
MRQNFAIFENFHDRHDFPDTIQHNRGYEKKFKIVLDVHA